MLKAMATSAAANPMIKSTKICPTPWSRTVNRLNAIRFNEAAAKISSPEISIPMRVRRRIKP